MKLSIKCLVVGSFVLKLVSCTDRNELWYMCPTDTGGCEDYDCTLDEGAKRAGYTCDEFPFYSGGFGPSEWNDEVMFEASLMRL